MSKKGTIICARCERLCESGIHLCSECEPKELDRLIAEAREAEKAKGQSG